MQSRLIEAPVLEPFTLAEVKAALRVTHSVQDDYIWTLAKSARKLCEDHARIAISPQRWLTTYRAPDRRGDEFDLTTNIADPDRLLRGPVVPKPPLINVVSVSFVYRDGLKTLMRPALDYTVDPDFNTVNWTTREVVYAITNPAIRSIEIDYACGNGLLNPGANSPIVADRNVRQVVCDDAIREAIFVTTSSGYDNPEGDMSTLPTRATSLLRPFRGDIRMSG